MNKMKDVAQLLEVEFDKPFNIVESSGNPYVIDESGLHSVGYGVNVPRMLTSLLVGVHKIEKTTFKPEKHETYYYVSETGRVEEIFWMGDVFDYMCYNMRNCFETEEEITQDDVDGILKEMKGKYENED